MPSQCELILKHLQEGKTITTLECLELYGCIRLPSRIDELRKEGYNVRIVKDPVSRTYSLYRRHTTRFV